MLAIAYFSPANTLDGRFSYSLSEASQYLSTLSISESHNYFNAEIADLVFIFAYSLFLFETLGRRGKHMLAIALATGFFDLIETSTILLILSKNFVVESTSYLPPVTTIKWIAALVALSTLAAVTIAKLGKKKATE